MLRQNPYWSVQAGQAKIRRIFSGIQLIRRYKNGLRTLSTLLLSLPLGACGFQLRGTAPAQLAFDSIRLECPGDQSRVLCTELQQKLQNAGVKINSQSDTILKIGKLNLNRRAVSLTSTATAAEYELTRSAQYTISKMAEESALSSGRVEQRQSYHYDETNVLAKSREEQNLINNLDRQLAGTILNRISAYGSRSSALP